MDMLRNTLALAHDALTGGAHVTDPMNATSEWNTAPQEPLCAQQSTPDKQAYTGFDVAQFASIFLMKFLDIPAQNLNLFHHDSTFELCFAVLLPGLTGIVLVHLAFKNFFSLCTLTIKLFLAYLTALYLRLLIKEKTLINLD
jgi:hypothetical protein